MSLKIRSTVCLGLLLLFTSVAGAEPLTQTGKRYYLPNAAASKIVSVTRGGQAAAAVTVLTQAVAIKETGPRATVKAFGEVYAFSPAFIAMHRDQPTMLTFWNLQLDDDHDLALMDRDLQVLMYVDLPPLKKTLLVFTFHREGVYDFKCMQHQPEMAGQILVLPPVENAGMPAASTPR